MKEETKELMENMAIVKLTKIEQTDFDFGNQEEFYQDLQKCYGDKEGFLFYSEKVACFRIGVEPLRLNILFIKIAKEYIFIETMSAR